MKHRKYRALFHPEAELIVEDLVPRQCKVIAGKNRAFYGGAQFVVFHELIINDNLVKCQAQILLNSLLVEWLIGSIDYSRPG
jgi:hypothetical protein